MERVSFEAPGPGRLDTVAAGGLGIPRAEVQRAIAEGRLLVDGRERAKSFHVAGGETIEVQLRVAGDLEPEPGPLAVLFEDDHLMVVSKPAGLITHGTASKRTGTLVNRLLALGVPLSTASGVDRPGIVHRLDAGTSGAITSNTWTTVDVSSVINGNGLLSMAMIGINSTAIAFSSREGANPPQLVVTYVG